MFRKSNKNFKNFKREPRNLTAIKDEQDATMPEKDQYNKRTDLLNAKTVSGLPRSGSSLSVKSDPFALVLPKSDPYAILNGPTTKAGGQYGGKDNLDGGLTNQLNTSELSNFLHCFDSMMVRCKVNYRYLPITQNDFKRGAGFVREMQQAIDEVISIAKSTTYTQLAINQYYISTDMPYLEGGELKAGDKTKEFSCGTAQGLYYVLICYQTYLQAFASVFNSYNKFRANQGLMLNMSWNRETPALNSFFSLMNKNSMVGQFKSLAYVLNGEYFDQEWMREFNLIASLVSRKSNSMTEPLKEVICTHSLPYFKLFIKSGEVTTTIFESTQFDALMTTSTNDNLTKLTFSEGFDYIAKRLSINDILYWVRNKTTYANFTEQSRFAEVSDFVSILQTAAGVFKPAMGDLRTMLDVIQRVGANSWTKSTKLEVFDNLDSNVLNNLTVSDLYNSLLSGSSKVDWDADTFRWRTYTIWDRYYGTPEYDSKSGGCFLTFSTKEIDLPVNNLGAADYMPILINGLLNEPGSTTRGGMVYAINRLGTSVELAPATYDPSVNPTSARLVPLNGLTLSVKIPYTAANLSVLDRSQLQAACLKAFGSFSNGQNTTIDATTDLAINPDYLCYITCEIEDLTNEMITYARTKGPFIVNIDAKSDIGFLGLTGV